MTYDPSFARKDIFMSIESFKLYIREKIDPAYAEQERRKEKRYESRERRRQRIEEHVRSLQQRREEEKLAKIEKATAIAGAIFGKAEAGQPYEGLFTQVRTRFGHATDSPFFHFSQGVEVALPHHVWSRTSGGINIVTSRFDDYELGIRDFSTQNYRDQFRRYASWSVYGDSGIEYPGPIYPERWTGYMWNHPGWVKTQDDDMEVIEVLGVIRQGLNGVAKKRQPTGEQD